MEPNCQTELRLQELHAEFNVELGLLAHKTSLSSLNFTVSRSRCRTGRAPLLVERIAPSHAKSGSLWPVVDPIYGHFHALASMVSTVKLHALTQKRLPRSSCHSQHACSGMRGAPTLERNVARLPSRMSLRDMNFRFKAEVRVNVDYGVISPFYRKVQIIPQFCVNTTCGLSAVDVCSCNAWRMIS